jgi:predicted O-methyltransferase YrrM
LSVVATEAATAPDTLAAFVATCRRMRVDAELMERIRAAYSPVLSLELDDDDLTTFLSVLYAAVRHWRPRTIVQTGTFVGASALALGFGLEDNGAGKVYTIDPEPPSYFGIREPVAVARRVVEAAGLGDRVQLVKGYSTVPLDGGRMKLPVASPWCLTRLPCRGRYDMLVVDGDHTFEGCLLDLEHGAAGLAPDGARLVIVHDYLGIPDVRRAVRRWSESNSGCEERVVPSRCGIALLRLQPQEPQTMGKELDEWSQLRRL